MRNIPGWPTAAEVVEPIVSVRHKGTERPVHELSITRELPSSFHAQTALVGGLTQATGRVEWAASEDVTTARPTAFTRANSWPPATRDRIDVYTGCRTEAGDLLAKQLTGVVSGGSGDPSESNQSGLVDQIARLSRTVNLPPLLNHMPPLTPGDRWRGVALYPMFFTDRAARAGSFFSTPGMAGGCVFSAPLMGSAWPERGTLVTGLRFTNWDDASAIWQETPWGMGVGDAYLSYRPSGASALDRTMEITAMTPGSPGEPRAYVAARWGDSDVRMSFRGNGVYGMVNGAVVCFIPYVDGNVFTLRVVPSGSLLHLTVRDTAGREASGTAPTPAGAGQNMSEVLVASEAAGSLIGGAQVSFPSTAWASLSYVRSAFITPAVHNASLAASPPIQDVTARTLLEEQSTAELSAMWIDGDGFLHWVNRNRLLAGNPVATLTSKDDLLSLPWEEDFAAVSSVVKVTSRQPEAVLSSKYPQHEVWRSNYSKVNANGTDEVLEELLHPGSDEDWIMVDTVFDNDYAAANNMRGSDVALYYFFENNVAPGQSGSLSNEGYQRSWVGASLKFINHRTYKLTTTVYPVSTPAWDKYEFSLKIPTEHQSVNGGGWPANLGGMNFPVIRAHGKVMWTDTTYTADSGVWDAPVLTHDVGWWVQNAEACQAIADLLAAQTTTPRPYLAGVNIVPDARLERGDIVTLRDTHLTGVEFRCLVVAIRDSFSANPAKWTQSCDFRVLEHKLMATG